MNFDQAYEKYQNGTANAEEKAYIEGEIEKARKLSSIIDNEERQEVIVKADISEVKKAKKAYGLKSAARTFIVIVSVLIIVAAAVYGGVFGTAIHSAKTGQTISYDQAKDIAIRYVYDNFTTNSGTVTVTDIDKNLDVQFKLKNSVYVYEVEVQNGMSASIDIKINANTGLVTLSGVDKT